MRGLRGLACLSVVLALAGCGDDVRDVQGPLQGDELAWTKDMDRWYRLLQEDLGAVAYAYAGNLGSLLDSDNASGLAQFKASLRKYERCSASLDEQVDVAPTKRLQRAREVAEEACSRINEATRATSAALAAEDYSQLVRLEPTWSKGFIVLQKIFVEIEKHTRNAAPLPTTTGSGSHIDSDLSRVVTAVSNYEAEVRCWSPEDWEENIAELKAMSSAPLEPAGFTSTDLKRVNVPVDVCARLPDVADPKASAPSFDDDLLDAVQLLAHEAMHVSGYWDEVEAECYGLQHAEEVALELGATDEVASELAYDVWQYLYPRVPAGYHSDECRNNGPLDLDRADDAWP